MFNFTANRQPTTAYRVYIHTLNYNHLITVHSPFALVVLE